MTGKDVYELFTKFEDAYSTYLYDQAARRDTTCSYKRMTDSRRALRDLLLPMYRSKETDPSLCVDSIELTEESMWQ